MENPAEREDRRSFSLSFLWKSFHFSTARRRSFLSTFCFTLFHRSQWKSQKSVLSLELMLEVMSRTMVETLGSVWIRPSTLRMEESTVA